MVYRVPPSRSCDQVQGHCCSRSNAIYVFVSVSFCVALVGLYVEIVIKQNIISSGAQTTYQVTVKTGDVRYAGTDANVYVKIFGEKGATTKLTLDDSKNNFERAMMDDFTVTL